jgi:hypothetical protein
LWLCCSPGAPPATGRAAEEPSSTTDPSSLLLIARCEFNSANITIYSGFVVFSGAQRREIHDSLKISSGDPATRWQSRVGSSTANSGGVVYLTDSIINHPNYNARTLDNDIAIIRTSSPIVFSDVIKAGSIARFNYSLGDNEVVWAAGWGATSVSIIVHH